MQAALADTSVASVLAAAASRLGAAGIDSARLDAEVLLAWSLGVDRTGLYARLREPVAAAGEDRFAVALERRCRREPVAYITGVQEFWSLPFAVTPAVLIPRPETELLVEIVCRFTPPFEKGGSGGIFHRAAMTPGAKSPPTPLFQRGEIRICDVGTGSGCIAVALARELPNARITALEVSVAALAVAGANAATHGVADRIDCTESDLFGALAPSATFDVIVSNPPYLAPGDVRSPEVGFEPDAALSGGDDGLGVIRRLIAAVPDHLRPGGWLVIELGAGQAEAARRLASDTGFVQVAIEPDLAGIARALVARRA